MGWEVEDMVGKSREEGKKQDRERKRSRTHRREKRSHNSRKENTEQEPQCSVTVHSNLNKTCHLIDFWDCIYQVTQIQFDVEI